MLWKPQREIFRTILGMKPTGLPYGRQEFGERWLLLTGEERALIDTLYARCSRLDDPSHTKQIFQGLITSADAVYHLKRKGPQCYICQPEGKPRPPAYEVEIEDALMKPLVSGAETKRYIEPETDTFLLFHTDLIRRVRICS